MFFDSLVNFFSDTSVACIYVIFLFTIVVNCVYRFFGKKNLKKKKVLGKKNKKTKQKKLRNVNVSHCW